MLILFCDDDGQTVPSFTDAHMHTTIFRGAQSFLFGVSLMARSCAYPHIVKVGFHEPEVGKSAPPVTYTFDTPFTL